MLPRGHSLFDAYSLSIEASRSPDSQSLVGDDGVDQTLLSLTLQSEQCAKLGSTMYERLFTALAHDYRSGGRTYAILAGQSERPIHDALPLRLAGALHRVVLRGDEPALARHYPSVGGWPGEDFPSAFIASMGDHRDEIETGLASQVQTNEVGRCVVPLTLSHWLTRFDIEEYDYLEVGASAGLNLNFDRYYARVRTLHMGDPDSSLRFSGEWFHDMPAVPTNAARVVRRRGVDPHPMDVSNTSDERRLLSFVWPDQRERMARLRTAVEIAKAHPPVIDPGSADLWVASQLARDSERATVVFHSIVWQYLGEATQRSLREALHVAGRRATQQRPLVWARMEPAGAVADVRATVWKGDEPSEYLLAEIGYHGQDMRWLVD